MRIDSDYLVRTVSTMALSLTMGMATTVVNGTTISNPEFCEFWGQYT